MYIEKDKGRDLEAHPQYTRRMVNVSGNAKYFIEGHGGTLTTFCFMGLERIHKPIHGSHWRKNLFG